MDDRNWTTFHQIGAVNGGGGGDLSNINLPLTYFQKLTPTSPKVLFWGVPRSEINFLGFVVDEI